MGKIIPFPLSMSVRAPRMYCASCGRDRSVPDSAADPGGCPCGYTMRVSAPLIGHVIPLMSPTGRAD